jgi:hypothetical protein
MNTYRENEFFKKYYQPLPPLTNSKFIENKTVTLQKTYIDPESKLNVFLLNLQNENVKNISISTHYQHIKILSHGSHIDTIYDWMIRPLQTIFDLPRDTLTVPIESYFHKQLGIQLEIYTTHEKYVNVSYDTLDCPKILTPPNHSNPIHFYLQNQIIEPVDGKVCVSHPIHSIYFLPENRNQTFHFIRLLVHQNLVLTYHPKKENAAFHIITLTDHLGNSILNPNQCQNISLDYKKITLSEKEKMHLTGKFVVLTFRSSYTQEISENSNNSKSPIGIPYSEKIN